MAGVVTVEPQSVASAGGARPAPLGAQLPLLSIPERALPAWERLQDALEESRVAGLVLPCSVATGRWFAAPSQAAILAEAAALCGRCPVVSECGEYALAAREADGVWGGLTVSERRAAGAGRPRC